MHRLGHQPQQALPQFRAAAGKPVRISGRPQRLQRLPRLLADPPNAFPSIDHNYGLH